MLDKLWVINRGLDKRFPDGREPFQMVTRLLEECGELAAEVNHFEGSGVKAEKHGPPDPVHLAKEIQDVLRCALQLASYYAVEEQLNASIEASYRQVIAEGLVEEL